MVLSSFATSDFVTVTIYRSDCNPHTLADRDVITQIYYAKQIATLFTSVPSNMPRGLSMRESKGALLMIVIRSRRGALYSKL